MANISIDTPFPQRSIHTTTDYSALCIYCQLELNLASIINAGRYFKLLSSKTLILEISNLTWSDGSQITSTQWIAGINFATTYNKLIRSLLALSNIKFIVREQRIIVTYESSLAFVLSTLSIVHLAPLTTNKRLYSGAYEVTSLRRPTSLVRRHLYRGSDPSIIELILMHTPKEHLNAFIRNSIDLTSFTSLSMESITGSKLNDYYYNSKTSLVASFQFSERFLKLLSFSQYKNIVKVIYGTEFSVSANNYWKDISDWTCAEYKKAELSGEIIASKKNQFITIVYDDYYPNGIVCRELKNSLFRNLGIKCRLLKDDYFDPHLTFDIRFNINHFFKRDCPLLRNVIAGLSENMDRATITQISRMEKAKSLIGRRDYCSDKYSHLPRFKVIGHYFSRIGKSPLIKACSEIYT